MPDDFEQRLRRSLEARAADVEPDPATWVRVQQRVARQRALRFAGAGLGLAALVAVAVMGLPALLNTARVELRPGPVATRPPAGPTPAAPPAEKPCAGDVVAAIFATTEGRLNASCAGRSGLEPVFDGDGEEAAPAISPDGSTVLFERRQPEGSGARVQLVLGDLATGGEVVRGEGYSPAFGPDGRHAFFRGAPADGRQPELVVPIGGEVFPVPIFDPDAEKLTASDLTWDPTGERLFWSAGYEGKGLWTLDLGGKEPGEPQRVGVYGVDSGSPMLAPASDGPGEVVAVHQCCTAGEAPTGAELGRVTLSGEDGEAGTAAADYRVIRDFVGVEGFSFDGPFDVEPAGTAEIVEHEGDGPFSWRRGQRAAWVVTSAGTAWLVDAGGNVVRLQDGVASVAFNAAAGLTAAAPVTRPDASEPVEPGTEGGAEPPPRSVQVQVYFGASGQQETRDCGFAQAYPRSVEPPAVARGALEALLAGPTQAEVDSGAASFFSRQTAGALNSVTITDGTANADFADFRDAASGASSSCGSAQLLAELDNTLLQFPAVQRTRYSFDGSVEAFYSWLGRPVPGEQVVLPAAVAATRDRLRDAARFAVESGDLTEIESLIPEDDFFCGAGSGACSERWRDEAGDVSPAMGALADVLGSQPAVSPQRPDLWVWPAGAPIDGSVGGPVVAVDEAGTWRQFVAP